MGFLKDCAERRLSQKATYVGGYDWLLAGWVMGPPPWHLSCLPRTRVGGHQPRAFRISGGIRNLTS